MIQKHSEELKNKLIKLHLQEGRTYNSLSEEYGVSKVTIAKWCKDFNKECQVKAENNSNSLNAAEVMKENLRLKIELEEMKK
ncbi:transposase, partial [Streptobacillus felis]